MDEYTRISSAAASYVAAGISVFPVKPDGSRSPDAYLLAEAQFRPDEPPKYKWGVYMTRRPSMNELEIFFAHWGFPRGIAVVCGAVSGNLEVLDIDIPEVVEPWLVLLAERCPEVLDRLVLVQSPRPGLHCYYRCSTIGSSTVLAEKPNPNSSEERAKPLRIETRGEGGYALAPPSPGSCHPSGCPYVYRSERTLADVQHITPEERQLLWELAGTYDERPPRSSAMSKNKRLATEKRQQRQAPSASGATAPRPLNRHLPGDDFCARVSWTVLLNRYGWTLSSMGADTTQYWSRPGKTMGTSASVGYAGLDLLYVWTTGTPELDAERTYTKFQFITAMEYDGDFNRAAAALKAEGYGQRRFPIHRHPPNRGSNINRRRRPRRGPQ